MRRCPKCNQEFADEWLTFCTQDGTSLIDIPVSTTEPPPTLYSQAMPPSVSPTEQPTLDMPGRQSVPEPYMPPAPLASGWNPPPPPAFPVKPQQALAVASFVLGMVSITVGWCCSFGVLTAPIALILGIVALVQIKSDPVRNGGKGFAIGGIVTGGLYFVIIALIILLYGIGFLLSGIS
jgi:Domain of unknown function (DUF4190)